MEKYSKYLLKKLVQYIIYSDNGKSNLVEGLYDNHLYFPNSITIICGYIGNFCFLNCISDDDKRKVYSLLSYLRNNIDNFSDDKINDIASINEIIIHLNNYYCNEQEYNDYMSKEYTKREYQSIYYPSYNNRIRLSISNDFHMLELLFYGTPEQIASVCLMDLDILARSIRVLKLEKEDLAENPNFKNNLQRLRSHEIKLRTESAEPEFIEAKGLYFKFFQHLIYSEDNFERMLSGYYDDALISDKIDYCKKEFITFSRGNNLDREAIKRMRGIANYVRDKVFFQENKNPDEIRCVNEMIVAANNIKQGASYDYLKKCFYERTGKNFSEMSQLEISNAMLFIKLYLSQDFELIIDHLNGEKHDVVEKYKNKELYINTIRVLKSEMPSLFEIEEFYRNVVAVMTAMGETDYGDLTQKSK